MKTEVIMKRPFLGREVRQKSKSEFLSGTDLSNAGNQWRAQQGLSRFEMHQWLEYPSTKVFIDEIEREYGVPAVIKGGRGRNANTWLHPLLFVDMALAISPKLKLETYKWLYDQLLKFRNDSGSSFNLMKGALYTRYPNKRDFGKYMVNVCNRIKYECNVTDWQTADEAQLELRDTIHKNIALLAGVLTDTDQAVAYGLKEALK